MNRNLLPGIMLGMALVAGLSAPSMAQGLIVVDEPVVVPIPRPHPQPELGLGRPPELREQTAQAKPYRPQGGPVTARGWL